MHDSTSSAQRRTVFMRGDDGSASESSVAVADCEPWSRSAVRRRRNTAACCACAIPPAGTVTSAPLMTPDVRAKRRSRRHRRSVCSTNTVQTQTSLGRDRDMHTPIPGNATSRNARSPPAFPHPFVLCQRGTCGRSQQQLRHGISPLAVLAGFTQCTKTQVRSPREQLQGRVGYTNRSTAAPRPAKQNTGRPPITTVDKLSNRATALEGMPTCTHTGPVARTQLRSHNHALNHATVHTGALHRSQTVPCIRHGTHLRPSTPPAVHQQWQQTGARLRRQRAASRQCRIDGTSNGEEGTSTNRRALHWYGSHTATTVTQLTHVPPPPPLEWRWMTSTPSRLRNADGSRNQLLPLMETPPRRAAAPPSHTST